MPFAAIRPAMGASLLVSHLRGVGVSARVEYLNMGFARLLGPTDYGYISDRAPTQSLAGDWVFSASLFGERPAADAAYAAAFRERFGRYGPCDEPLAMLGRARAQASTFIDACLDQVEWTNYDLVGFTSSFTQHVASLAIARRVKERHPDLLTVFGGANCEDEMGLTLHQAFPFVDFVCSGEADISFPQLLTELMAGRDGHDIPGIISRRDGASHVSTLVPERVRDLDTLPNPDFDDFFAQRTATWPEADMPAQVLMESSRGCWWGQKHHCTFCGLNGMAMTFRSKSAERVLAEITELTRRYSAEHVEMVDNILDMDYLSDLLPELARRRLRLKLFYETKANLRKDQLRLLRAAGVTSIQPGIESFSTGVLRLMRKGTTAAQNVQLLKWCAELGIEVAWNLLYGFPREDPDDYRDMPSLIDSVSHLEPPRGTSAIRLDRFSPNYVSAQELGLSDVRPDRSYGLIYDLPADELAGIAYYFEHDHADGRDPLDYVGETYEAVRRWHSGRRAARLICVDHPDGLAIWDFRPVAHQRLTILNGIERLIYIHCDQQRAHRSITELVAESDDPGFALDPFLEELVTARLMLAVDDRYLSLAVEKQVPETGTIDDRARSLEPALVF
jgi:ribosomal peptide maturation radical SAM protein 1